MKIEFLTKSPSNSRLILVFAGWSTGPDLYRDIRREGWDVAVCHSFTSFSLPEGMLDRYPTVVVYAWSFGVFAAMRALQGRRVTAAYALNGTGRPVHPILGIHPDIFHGTLAGLNPRNLAKFRRRMVADSAQMQALAPMLDPSPDIEALASQLRAIEAEPSDGPDTLPWRRVFISEDDRIIPPSSQRAYWEAAPSSPQIVPLRGGHYHPLSAIVDATLPHPEKVGSKFRNALPTYNDHATAQRIIAGHLSDRVPMGLQADRILEIGAGNGLFTRMYSVRLKARHATFVDLYTPAIPFAIAESEEYVEADAERWMETAPDASFDVILSASAMQWFVDPERFLANAARVLRPGGRLICSTYVTGNLAELDALRPSPILYHAPEELLRMARRHFPDAEVAPEEVRLLFPTPREALLHLRRTGVGGGATSPSGLRALLRALTPADPSAPTPLTFKAAILTATR